MRAHEKWMVFLLLVGLSGIVESVVGKAFIKGRSSLPRPPDESEGGIASYMNDFERERLEGLISIGILSMVVGFGGLVGLLVFGVVQALGS